MAHAAQRQRAGQALADAAARPAAAGRRGAVMRRAWHPWRRRSCACPRTSHCPRSRPAVPSWRRARAARGRTRIRVGACGGGASSAPSRTVISRSRAADPRSRVTTRAARRSAAASAPSSPARASAASALDTATADVLAALAAVENDPRGRWLFDPAHEDAHSEWALAGLDAGRLVHVTLDRTFVADGVRWIVDFKTGRHEGADRAAFLDAGGGALPRAARALRPHRARARSRVPSALRSTIRWSPADGANGPSSPSGRKRRCSSLPRAGRTQMR